MEELLTKYFAGNISQQEKLQLFAAMERDAALKENFCHLQNALAFMALQPEEHDSVIGGEQFRQFMQRRRSMQLKRTVQRLWRYAAVICVVATSVYFLSNHFSDRVRLAEVTEIVAPGGQRVQVRLPDGTLAWIGPNSKLRYSGLYNRKEREVQLAGTTYFSVAHNADKPFRVSTGKYVITALGTRFNVAVYSGDNRFEVDLMEGSVRIDHAADTTDHLILKPHERAVIKDRRLCKLSSDKENEIYLSKGIVNFDSCVLGEVLSRVALWQDVEFEIGQNVDVTYPMTGKIRQDDELENILRALQSLAHFRYQYIDERHIRIYR